MPVNFFSTAQGGRTKCLFASSSSLSISLSPLSLSLSVFSLSLSPFAPGIIASFEILVGRKSHPYLMTEPNQSIIDPSLGYQTFTRVHFLCSVLELLSHQSRGEVVLCYAKSLQSCPALCDPMDCSPRGSSVHGILRARILEWVAIPSSKGSSLPGDQTHISYISCIGSRVLYH